MRVAPDYVVDGEAARQIKKMDVELLEALRYARLGDTAAAAAAKSIKCACRFHVWSKESAARNQRRWLVRKGRCVTRRAHCVCARAADGPHPDPATHMSALEPRQ